MIPPSNEAAPPSSASASASADGAGGSPRVGRRQSLPGRRWNRTSDLEWRGIAYKLCVGFDPMTGQIREIFCSGPHTTSHFQAMLDDACVAISRALQFGDSVVQMAASLGRESTDYTAPKASLLGIAVEEAARIQNETDASRRKGE